MEHMHSEAYGMGAKRRRMMKGSKAKVHAVMSEYKHGSLHSGGSKKIVTNRNQAIAIALSEARRRKKG